MLGAKWLLVSFDGEREILVIDQLVPTFVHKFGV